MKERTRKIFIMIVMAALIVSLMAASLCYAFTYGRYSGGRLDDNSTYDDLIDFVGATAFEVSTPDEFVNAIENGYSYIKISEGAEKPFVINNDIADVYTNLVLDVNGTTVIRNSRNPVLDVRRSISVVLVYDSSVEGSGGFYNPVGSALQTSGGSLTVGSGSYESGPKVKGSSSFSSDTSVTLYTRTSRTAGSYETKVEDTSMPSLSGDVYYTGDTTQYTYIENDTYLLYTEVKNAFVGKGETSDDATFESGQLYVNCKEFTTDGTQTTYSADIFAPDSNVASCDFYYYYPIDESGAYSSTAGTVDSPKTYAVVYGYNDVKGLAEDEDDNNDGIGEATALIDDGLVWPYAAIRSVEDGEVGGVTHARGGVFKTHFGEENTYCIYSAGGTMTVGTSGSAGGPAFEAVGSGVCIAMTGASDNVSEGGSLTISGGTFSSRLGNTIEMENGNMTVTAGSFTKSDGKGIERDQLEDQTAMIDMRGGTLNITGDNADSVTMTAGGKDKPLENVFGILAHGGGEVSVGGCTFNIYGNYSAGVLSYDGTINLNDDTVINVRETHPEDKITSAGVSSEQASEGEEQASEGAEEHPVNLTGNVKITSDGLGITARGNVNIKKAPDNQSATQVNVETGYATGVYVNGGTFKMESGAEISVESTVQNGYTWGLPPEGQGTSPNIYNGVYVQGGSLVSEGTLNVTFTGVENEARNVSGNDQIVYNGENTSFLNQQTKSYAVRVEAGTGTNTNVTIDSGNITNTVGGGVLVNGGKVTLGTTGEGAYNESTKRGLTVQTTGTEVNTSLIYINGMADNWAYYWNMKGGDAVKVDGGDLYVYGGKYTAAQGNGILTRGGTANIFNGIFTGGYNSNYHATTGAASTYSFKAYGGTVKISGGDFNSEAEGAFVMGTSDDDKVTITGGSFQADGPTAFATWNGATVEFDDTNSENKITVSGESTGLTVEQVSSGWRSQNITIKSATFKSTNQNQSNKNGIWYGNGNAKLTISGGSFTGTTGSGLSIGETPNYDWNTWTHNIQLSGGSFKGGWNAPISNYSSNYLVSGAWTSGNNTSGQTFYIYS